MEFTDQEQGSSYVKLQDVQLDENGEIHYIQCDDDNEMLLADNGQVDLTNLILEDGTTAMLVNGTLLTSNGETIILQDDDGNLTHFMINDANNVSESSEEQYLQVMSSDVNDQTDCTNRENDNFLITSPTISDQQLLYLQDTHMFLPIAGVYDQESSQETQTLQLEGNEFSETDGVIDLDQLLKHQNTTDLQNNYQYAVLRDGKFHLQLLDSDDLSGLLNNINSDSDIVIENSDDITIPCNTSDLKLTDIKGKNVKTGQVITLYKYLNKTLNNNQKGEVITKLPCNNNEKNSQIVNKSLMKLINKKIPLGRTNEGKKLVGKIINIVPKSEVNSQVKTTSKVTPRTSNQIQTSLSESKPKPNLKLSKANNVNTYSKPKPRPTLKPNIQSAVADKQTDLIQKPASSEPSKVLIHEKTVSKDCFATISRTLKGLMNMDSVVKKLKNKIIIIKVVQKTFNEHTSNFTKTVSYCSGIMEREFKSDHEGTFSEAWNFVPDSNSRKTILGQHNNEEGGEQEQQPNYKKYASLTIEITKNKDNQTIPRVIINPTALYQCKACTKGFQTSTLLRLHTIQSHPQESSILKTPKTNKRLTTASTSAGTVPEKQALFECSECHQQFITSGDIRKHMEVHHTKMTCSICKKVLANSVDLKKHMQLHLKMSVVTTGVNNQKVLSCHICSRQFSRYSNLQRHIEIHKGEGAMYQCAICSCSYHYISSLTRHVVSCHLEQMKKNNELENSNEPSESQEIELLEEVIPLEQISEERSLGQYSIVNEEYLGS